MAPSDGTPATNTGILGWIERTGNRLPDPVFIFLYLIAGLILFSVFAAWVDIGPRVLNRTRAPCGPYSWRDPP